jgi:phosphohistidine phosphatase
VKTLYLLRHGKSDWNTSCADHERPLAPRGVDAAHRIGRFLRDLDEVPDRIVASTAERARETARLAKEAGDWSPEVELEAEFYGTDPEGLLDWLRRVDDGTQSILLAGHMPTWPLFAGGLIGGGQLRYPTAALAKIGLHVDRWRDVEFGCGELVWFQLPRVLKRIGDRFGRQEG